MGNSQDSDEGLMAEVALGSRECLHLLMRRYGTSLLTFIQRMTGNRQSSEDLFQEVFLALWLQSRRYDASRSFRAWLFGIAANKCRSEYRKVTSQSPTGEGSERIEEPRASPQEIALQQERAVIVQQAVKKLPTMQRQVAVLRIWNEMPYDEIADVLKCSEGTVRSHMFHALTAMRKYLEPRLR